MGHQLHPFFAINPAWITECAKKKMPLLNRERRHYMFYVKRYLRFVALEATLLKLTARGIDVSPA